MMKFSLLYWNIYIFILIHFSNAKCPALIFSYHLAKPNQAISVSLCKLIEFKILEFFNSVKFCHVVAYVIKQFNTTYNSVQS